MEGFVIGNGEYAAVPYGKYLLVIHNGQQLPKVCRTEASARRYIKAHTTSLKTGTVLD